MACLSLKSALDPLIFYFITFLPTPSLQMYFAFLLAAEQTHISKRNMLNSQYQEQSEAQESFLCMYWKH